MEFKPFIYNAKQEQIPVSIAPMTDADAQKTISAWQTAWTSDYLSDLRLEKYAAKLDEELIALGAHEILENALVIHIAYMEAQPESNPTLDGGTPKYTGIGD